MGVVGRSKIQDGGRLVVPAELRRELGLQTGTDVVLDIVDGSLRVRTMADIVKEVQTIFRPYKREGESVVDEFIAEKRAEAARE